MLARNICGIQGEPPEWKFTYTREYICILSVLLIWLDEAIIWRLAEEVFEALRWHSLAITVDEMERS